MFYRLCIPLLLCFVARGSAQENKKTLDSSISRSAVSRITLEGLEAHIVDSINSVALDQVFYADGIQKLKVADSIKLKETDNILREMLAVYAGRAYGYVLINYYISTSQEDLFIEDTEKYISKYFATVTKKELSFFISTVLDRFPSKSSLVSALSWMNKYKKHKTFENDFFFDKNAKKISDKLNDVE